MFDTLADWAEEFIGVFQAGAETFVGLVVGIIPLLIVLLTAVNAFVALIGPDRVDKVGDWAARPGWIYTPIRYLIWPFLSVFFLTNPMAYTNGRFLPEKFKPAFYDSAVSMVHPPLGLFPHVNPGELFVWLGIAAGVEAAGFDTDDLAVRYLFTGFIVIYIRGVVTAFMTARLGVRQDRTHAERLPSTAA
jgi:PTS system glucitol/sorbitol-specific IIC component